MSMPPLPPNHYPGGNVGQQPNMGHQNPHAQQMHQGQQMPQGQHMHQGQQMPQGQQMHQGQHMSSGQHMAGGHFMHNGQEMPRLQSPYGSQSPFISPYSNVHDPRTSRDGIMHSTQSYSDYASELKHFKTEYEGWAFEKLPATEKDIIMKWEKVTRRRMQGDSDDFADQVSRHRADRKYRTGNVTDDYEKLSDNQRSHIDRLIDDKMVIEANPFAQWNLASIRTDTRSRMYKSKKVKETVKIRVILKKEPRKHTHGKKETLYKRDIVDVHEPRHSLENLYNLNSPSHVSSSSSGYFAQHHPASLPMHGFGGMPQTFGSPNQHMNAPGMPPNQFGQPGMNGQMYPNAGMQPNHGQINPQMHQQPQMHPQQQQQQRPVGAGGQFPGGQQQQQQNQQRPMPGQQPNQNQQRPMPGQQQQQQQNQQRPMPGQQQQGGNANAQKGNLNGGGGQGIPQRPGNVQVLPNDSSEDDDWDSDEDEFLAAKMKGVNLGQKASFANLKGAAGGVGGKGMGMGGMNGMGQNGANKGVGGMNGMNMNQNANTRLPNLNDLKKFQQQQRQRQASGTQPFKQTSQFNNQSYVPDRPPMGPNFRPPMGNNQRRPSSSFPDTTGPQKVNKVVTTEWHIDSGSGSSSDSDLDFGTESSEFSSRGQVGHGRRDSGGRRRSSGGGLFTPGSSPPSSLAGSSEFSREYEGGRRGSLWRRDSDYGREKYDSHGHGHRRRSSGSGSGYRSAASSSSIDSEVDRDRERERRRRRRYSYERERGSGSDSGFSPKRSSFDEGFRPGREVRPLPLMGRDEADYLSGYGVRGRRERERVDDYPYVRR
ncbi:hypothetical protein K402DRAFT_245137 [Aulographum hederae CBS 113979]|uniref:Uncharacterized protein n=1 Tax=Aulographum hederae CBS 113979 TaxID=1176131 RepID=A0A6G1H9X5_9PEZI|nr:hypothetical protein K402DRAFT_245137 [Aulographum hederae CBS 113979]